MGRFKPLRRPTVNPNASNDDEDQKVHNAMAAIPQKEVYSGHDALNLLFEAAGRNGDIDHHRTRGSGSLQRRMVGTGTPGSQTSIPSPQANGVRGMDGRNQSRTTGSIKSP